MTTIKCLAVASLALIACGDNKSRPDAATRRDTSAPDPDAYCSSCPTAPTIGTTQIDRMGRPAINTVLIKAFNDETPTSTAGGTAKDAYNANSNKSTWLASSVAELAANIAIIDVIDGVLDNNGICELGESNGTAPGDCPGTGQNGTAPPGCGNAPGYSSAGTNATQAYATIAGLLADDRLYLDTGKTMCLFYFAVEFGELLSTPNTTCGGRAPQYDVVDFSYSALSAGPAGFSTDGTFTPRIGDGVTTHTDLLTAFPYLGAPH